MTVGRGLAGATALLVALLGAASYADGLAGAAWPVALGCWAVAGRWVAGAAPHGRLGPADVVTLVRTALGCGAAGLVVDGLVATGDGPVPVLFPVCATALLLDAVDGPVARRTGTTSAFGGRFDGEADAFVMLVLSVQVASTTGWWVLVLGLLRYVFGLAGMALPWLARRLPLRWWRKVGAAAAGVALVAAVPGVLPAPVATAGLLVALALLLESFGRDVAWLWRQRSRRRAMVPAGSAP